MDWLAWGSPASLAGQAVLALPLLFLSLLLHEAGHALAGRAAGYRITAMGLGVGGPLLVRQFGPTRFYLCRRAPLQAITWTLYPGHLPARWRTVCLLLGGPGANLLLAGLFFACLFARYPLPYTLLVCGAANLCFAVGNLLPLRDTARFGLRSDGAQVVAALRRTGWRPAPLLGANLAPRPLWEAVGDTPLLRHHLLLAAAHALDIGETAGAREWLDEARKLPARHGEEPPAWAELLQAVLARREGREADAEAAFAAVTRTLRAHGGGASAGLLLTAIQRRDADAYARLGEWDGHPLLRAFPHVATAHAAARLENALRRHPERVDAALARFEAARALARADAVDLAAYAALARHRAASGDRAGAELAREQAERAALRMDAALATAPDLLRRHRERTAHLRRATPAR